MSSWLSIAAAALVAFLALGIRAFLFSPISPLPLHLPPLTATPNNLLQGVEEKLGEGRVEGPEDVFVDGDGTLYTAARDGWIKRMHRNGSWEENWRLVGGSALLGLALSRSMPGHVLVADADKGLLRVGEEGVVTLASHVNGSKIRFADDLAEDSDGSVYFSDASSKFGLHNWFLEALEARPNGRLLKYDAATGQTAVVLPSLAFPNGVALSADERFLVVCESTRFRCLKHWLRGEKAGETEVFVDDLPGVPDNIKLGPDGCSFWVALLKMRSPGMDLLHRSPMLKKVLAATFPQTVGGRLVEMMRGGAMVANVGLEGEIRRVMEDAEGKVMSFVTSVVEHEGHLYMGSLYANFIGRLKLMS